ncbi:MAG: hypothetical protein ACD_28C00386G0008 [uncultured bacterium]|nr:MAG: hypothetical protein ACD_28C00386G0008 [uncultured bacterium]
MVAFDWNMAKQEFRRALDVARFHPDAMDFVARHASLNRNAAIFIALASLAGAVGSLLFPLREGRVSYSPTIVEALFNAGMAVLLIGLVLFLLNGIAERVFRAPSDFGSFFRVVGYGYVVGFLNVVPALRVLTSLWVIVLIIQVLMRVKRLSLPQAVISLVFLSLLLFVVFVLFQGLNPANLYGGLYFSPTL